MSNKRSIAVFFGGKSAEHDVSLVSARNIIQALDKELYEILPVGIDRNGIWHLVDIFSILNSSKIEIKDSDPVISIIPGKKEFHLVDKSGAKRLVPDVAFPVLHGPFGEDGSIQGIFRHICIPFVGADVAGSVIGMDKDIMKRILLQAKIPIGKFITLRHFENPDPDKIFSELGNPVFVKPANMGSSIGVNRAGNRPELLQAIETAFKYDTKIVLEKAITGREIECSVLGNSFPESSNPGEIVTGTKFYSYDEKYDASSEAKLIIPAPMNPALQTELKNMAVKTYRALECMGFARVDFFVTDDDKILVNEINTLPGFTSISMYPKLWENDGLPTPELLNRLIKFAEERFELEKKLKKTV
jgi:D-alanine-D-alanine ligase